MATHVPYRFWEPGINPAERRYFPSATVRCCAPDLANTAGFAPFIADHSPLISVAYTWIAVNREGHQLATGIERRNDGLRQTPKAEEFASARRAGTNPRAARRWSRSAAGRAGSPARPSCCAGGFRGTDEGTPDDALLTREAAR